MILGTLTIPKSVTIPEAVLKEARSPEIVTRPADKLGADEWVGCCYAWPHIDDHWASDCFLTLSVRSKHQIGDAKSRETINDVPRGTFFVIDPSVAHWLLNRESHWNTRNAPWIGLQWVVPRKEARDKAREIMASFRGVWASELDPRYEDWRP